MPTYQHGHNPENSSTYRAWLSMKRRCTNPNYLGFDNYGGRGISVCDEWSRSFEVFLLDMGEKPEGFCLDRIDNEQGYSKGNCRWLPKHLSSRNRRCVKLTKEIVENIRTSYIPYKTSRVLLAKKFGIHRSVIDKVLSREIWT